MKIEHSSKRHRYLVRVRVFLIMIALIAGTVGCDDESYVLAISSTEGGSVTAPGEGAFTYNATTVVNLVAESEESYYFVNWTGDVETIASVGAAKTTIAMTDDCEITANFEQIPPGQFALTLSSTEGGSIIAPGEGAFTYDAATVVSLVAESEEGCYFVNWTGDVETIASVSAATTTIAMTDDCEITANFEQIPPGQFTLTLSSTIGGSVTVPGEGTFIYGEGTLVSLVADPEDGYHFVNWSSDTDTIADVNSAVTTITMDDNYSITANFRPEYNPALATGWAHTVGVKSDGTVVAVGDNDWGQCDVEDWMDITQVTAGYYHTVGLQSDGTVVAAGWNDYEQCDVTDWMSITQVAAGYYHTVGLKSDGTVMAVGRSDDGQCGVGNWTDVVQIAAGGSHTVGLKSDGTAIAMGWNGEGQCDVGGWTGISQVAAGRYHTVGLKSDGTVVAVGEDDDGQCNVGSWMDITQVAAGGYHTTGRRTDGSAVAVGDNSFEKCGVGDWTAISKVAAGGHHTAGLRSDGTVRAAGWNEYGQCDVSDWTDII
jgi:hypothetical protein